MITNLKIKNFKGIKNVEYNNFGLVNAIYGKNETGKTTILDCIMWLLCGATLTYGDGNIDDKCINQNFPNELIEASLTINGNTIERVFGHKLGDNNNIIDVNYFYTNGRKCKSKKEYFELVDSYLGITLESKSNIRENINLKYALINPYFFGKEIKQDVFRRFIMQILNVDFNDIIFKNTKFDVIESDYKSQGCDDNNLKQLYRQKINEINNQLNEINVKLDSQDQVDESESKLEKLIEKKAKYKLEHQIEYTNSEIQRLAKEISDTTIELSKSQSKDMLNSISEEEKSLSKEINELKTKINSNIDKYNEISDNLNIAYYKQNAIKMSIELHEKNLEILQNSKFERIECPNCHTILNEEKEKTFNFDKAEKVKVLNSKLEDKNKQVKEIEKEIELFKSQINDITKIIKNDKDLLNEKKVKLETLSNAKDKNIDSKETIDLKDKLNSLNVQIEEEQNKLQSKNQELKENTRIELEKIDNEIIIEKVRLSKIDEIKRLKESKLQLISAKIDYETKLVLANELSKNLCKITENYSKRIFGDDVGFVMVTKNKTNDDYKRVCYAHVYNIPYESLNTANALLTGIIVVEKIKAFLNLKDIPILFDIIDNIGNATLENILSKTNSQIFFTQVDRTDKEERQVKIIK